LLDELLKSSRSDEQVLEALYLATLARLPAAGEKKHILGHLAGEDRGAAFKDALWALLNTSEFHEHLKEWNALNPGNLPEFLRQLNDQAPEADSRKGRVLRWNLLFHTENGDEYLRQLKDIRPGGGAFLAVPPNTGRYEVLRDLSKRPAAGAVEDLKDIKRIFWLDDKPDSVAGLARALGIKPPPHFVVFFPSELEEELLRLEREKANGAPEEAID